jgi:hypothetical protein
MNQRTPGPLVDVHAHFLTPHYVEAARTAGHGRPDGNPGWPAWEASRHIDLMDEWGVGTSLLSISSPAGPRRPGSGDVGDTAPVRPLDSERRAVGPRERGGAGGLLDDR